MDSKHQTADGYVAYIGVKEYDGPKSYLAGTYSWRLVKPDGTLLGDGEGCLSRAEAVETASMLGREEFRLNV
jgi:hypothetical protein